VRWKKKKKKKKKREDNWKTDKYFREQYARAYQVHRWVSEGAWFSYQPGEELEGDYIWCEHENRVGWLKDDGWCGARYAGKQGTSGVRRCQFCDDPDFFGSVVEGVGGEGEGEF
jgi:hypothetical protein